MAVTNKKKTNNKKTQPKFNQKKKLYKIIGKATTSNY